MTPLIPLLFYQLTREPGRNPNRAWLSFWQRAGTAMAKAEELTVIVKAYDLILWSCKHTSGFPRIHRFALGERIERKLYDRWKR
jgi:hypothetical protein